MEASGGQRQRLNRVRERVGGWVLAGFEVTDVATRGVYAGTATA